MKTRDSIRQCIAKELGISVLGPNVPLDTVDSLDLLGVRIAIEDTFEVDIPISRFEDFRTFEDLIGAVDAA